MFNDLKAAFKSLATSTANLNAARGSLRTAKKKAADGAEAAAKTRENAFKALTAGPDTFMATTESDTSERTVARFFLNGIPPGTYAIDARAELLGAGPGQVNCTLVADGAGVLGTATSSIAKQSVTAISVSGTGVTGAGDTQLFCTGDPFSIVGSALTARRVELG